MRECEHDVKITFTITGWIAVQLDEYINYDLEKSPLQIKTDSEVGSNNTVSVSFRGSGSYAGGVSLYFSYPPQYELLKCNSQSNLLTDLPAEKKKVWTITRSSESGKERIVIHCNDKEVVNVVMSDTTCSESGWSTYWSKDVEKIFFSPLYNTASDFYRAGKNVIAIGIDEDYNRLFLQTVKSHLLTLYNG